MIHKCVPQPLLQNQGKKGVWHRELMRPFISIVGIGQRRLEGSWDRAHADRSNRKGIFAESVIFLCLVSIFSSTKLWLTTKSEGKLEKDIEILWIERVMTTMHCSCFILSA